MPLEMSWWGRPSRVLAGMTLEAGGGAGRFWAVTGLSQAVRIAAEPIANAANFNVPDAIKRPFLLPRPSPCMRTGPFPTFYIAEHEAPHPHHLRHPLCRRGQASGQPGRLHAAGRHLRPLLPVARL